MKKSFFILGLLTLICTSCSEDSLEPFNEDFFLLELVGIWHASEVVITSCNDEEENGSRTCSTDTCLILTIDPSGSYIVIDNFENPPATERGTVAVGESEIVFCSTGIADCETNSYILSDETLTISYQEPITECSSIIVLQRQ